MRFGLTCHAHEDWAVPDHETGYEYTDRASAEAAAEEWLRAQLRAGWAEEFLGVYVMSDDRDVYAGGDPSVDDLYVIYNGRLVNRGDGR